MREVVIVEAVRTPLGRRNGKLKDVHAIALGAAALTEVVKRPGIDPAEVEDVVMGCVMQVGEQSLNIGRTAWLHAGFPIETPATTVDRQCGSSQQALHFAANLIQAGTCDVTIAAGVESMTRVPMGSTASVEGVGRPATREIRNRFELVSQGISAEMIAEKWGITREECDEFSVESHRRAARATDEGRFESQIIPVEITTDDGETEVFSRDEGIRPDSNVETLAKLKPSFREDGLITAGNSSQITDGAAAVLLMTPEKAAELGVRPRARIVAQAVVGVDPVFMLTGPIPGTEKVLRKAGLTFADIDLVEINEAFAPVVLAWKKEFNPDMEKVNVNGGAIAIGHPLGATGARLATTLLNELERTGGRYGLETMCCGGGLGTATIIERLDG
ncbi:MAG: steroid 3-ketoacyl-CoA thiolase [Acidobacteria bacterium]|nr:MAG: steroid 3-ketoacyl-CoA thiolase [Acidobacteriota bacterium]